KVDDEVEINGVRIVGLANLPGRVAGHASQMYSSNLRNLLEHFWNKEKKSFVLNLEDEIIDESLVTKDKTIRSEMLRQRYAEEGK
ncbi:MAG TPA: NAD(P)(+) transhydrogenase (Re/Si-specific) subunit alpha, partial [Anaerolineae bacterium]|nr:NAD(P)(+) transhydrogenase (Re/Si-specific) subunit alpha [Anaerolineae bacterium]